MPRFFNKFRVDAIRNNKVFNYLLYAIGEILLVTIGILIAVSLNNSNENRKQVEELQAIYTAIENDLTSDTLFLYQEIEDNIIIDSIIQEILLQDTPIVSIDTINEQNANSCYPCKSLNTVYSPFTPSKKGYDALKGFENNFSRSQDALSLKILEHYSRNIDLIKTFEKAVGDHAVASLAVYEKKPWYLSIAMGKFNKDAIAYFLYDLEYRNRLATFSLLNTGNYMAILKDYQLKSKEIIEEIKRSRE